MAEGKKRLALWLDLAMMLASGWLFVLAVQAGISQKAWADTLLGILGLGVLGVCVVLDALAATPARRPELPGQPQLSGWKTWRWAVLGLVSFLCMAVMVTFSFNRGETGVALAYLVPLGFSLWALSGKVRDARRAQELRKA